MTTTYRDWRYSLAVGLLLLIALGVFLIFDLEIALSINGYFTLAYTAFWLLIGFLLLRHRPNRYKLSLLALFLTAILVIYFIDWNGRKPFLRDFHRIELGMTADQADQMMAQYIKFVGPTTQLNAQGKVLTGKVSYRPARLGWGDSDIAILTIENGQVVDLSYYPD
ncbi:MAG: hypothetical protein H6631_15630 [Anaerolineaceae bacterium]|nr:hypothetical protein [Anaerolineaceae bacterium]MCB9098986.1 hypothetical protein [Anaerolineales bacterium]